MTDSRRGARGSRADTLYKRNLLTTAGEPFFLEEVAHRPHPIARWYSREANNWRRLTVAVVIRDAAGRLDSAAVAKAESTAVALVSARRAGAPQEPSASGTAPTTTPTVAAGLSPSTAAVPASGTAAGGTLEEAIRLATDPTQSGACSPRWLAELKRYGDIALAILGKDTLAAAVGAAELRMLFTVVAETTRREIDQLRTGTHHAGHGPRPSLLSSVLGAVTTDETERGYDDDEEDARTATQRQQSAPLEVFVGRTARRELAKKLAVATCTLLRHAAAIAPHRFGACEKLGLFEHFKRELHALWSKTFPEFALSDDPERERYPKRVGVQMLHALRDPRMAMYHVLASAVNTEGAHRVRWTDVVMAGERIAVRQEVDKRIGSTTKRDLDDAAARLFVRLLDGGYAHALYGRDFQPDDLLIPPGRWVGLGTEPFVRDDTVFELEPRMQLLYDLFAEKRLGQCIRLMRSQIAVDAETPGVMLITIPNSGRKRGFTMMLCPVQLESLALAMTVGYLRELEAAYRAGTITDYPIFPGGKLKDGCSPLAGAKSTKPMHRRTVAKYCARLERMVGFAPQWTEAERAALRAHKDASRPERSTTTPARDAETVPAEDGEADLWKGERPLVGNYGLRRTLIDLVHEVGAPSVVADLISCHAPTVELMHGAKSRRGPGTRVGIYMNTADRVLLHQAAEVVQRLRTRPYAPTRLSFSDDEG